MRLRKILTGAALMSLALTMPQAVRSPDTVGDVAPSRVSDNSTNAQANVDLPVRSSLIAKSKVLASAYLDTLTILSTSNGGGAFFGGPKASMDIFSQLISRVRKKLANRHGPEWCKSVTAQSFGDDAPNHYGG